jgi:hypothetical protein
MNIPKSFQLGGITYTVDVTDNREAGIKNNQTGTIVYALNKVFIYNDHVGYVATDDYKELSFYHELVHGILTAMGKSDMNNDEEFVEGFASYLHQFTKTVKYD